MKIKIINDEQPKEEQEEVVELQLKRVVDEVRLYINGKNAVAFLPKEKKYYIFRI